MIPRRISPARRALAQRIAMPPPRLLARLLEAGLRIGWCAGFGLGALFAAYAIDIQYRIAILSPPLSLTPGSFAEIVTHIARMTVFGAAFLAFLLGLSPYGDAEASQRASVLAQLLRQRARPAALYVLVLVVLGAVRDALEFELHEKTFGEGIHRGSLEPRDLLSGAVVGALAVLAFLAWQALGEGTPTANDSREAQPPSSGDAVAAGSSTLGAAVACALLVLVVWRIVSWPWAYFGQDLHFEHVRVHSRTWQMLLAAALLASDDPLRALGSFGAWLQRNAQPLALLVGLDFLRVIAHQDWYVELDWMAGILEHAPRSVLFFRGHLHDVVDLVVTAPLLVVTLLLLGRWARHAAQR